MSLSIKKDVRFSEGSITIVGVTRNLYGRPQCILVDSDKGADCKLKFPGLKFRAPRRKEETLDDVVRDRFEEQTGLTIDTMLGLRAIMPARSRHGDIWIFQNIFLGVINDLVRKDNDGRNVYVSEPGQGMYNNDELVTLFGDSKNKKPLQWANQNDRIVARFAKDVLFHFDWENQTTNYFRRIPCLGVTPQIEDAFVDKPKLGYGLAVSSVMLLYQENPYSQQKVILLKRKGDKYPGYAGGKIETLISGESRNLDPISCCVVEGAEECGFDIQPRALIGVAVTPLDCDNVETHYNTTINYAFVAEPTNHLKVKEALINPRDFLENKMESYVVETLDEHRDRILRRELRMPDMIEIGNQFYQSSPGDKIPLTQFISSGSFYHK